MRDAAWERYEAEQAEQRRNDSQTMRDSDALILAEWGTAGHP